MELSAFYGQALSDAKPLKAVIHIFGKPKYAIKLNTLAAIQLVATCKVTKQLMLLIANDQ